MNIDATVDALIHELLSGNRTAENRLRQLATEALSARPEDGWISTAPGHPLPKPNETVLIWYNQKPDGWRVYLGRYIHQLDQWRPEGGNGDFRDLISHWRPLPASPRPQKETR